MISQRSSSIVDESASHSFRELIALADEKFSLYQQTSDKVMLDLAAGHYRAAFDLGPALDDTVDYASALLRFQRTLLLCGRVQGDNAIANRYVNNAIQVTPPTHQLRPILSALQAASYLKRYQESKDTADIHSAVEIYKTVVDTIPITHPQRVHLQMQYASALHTRYTVLRDGADLDLSIQQFWAVLEGCPSDLFVTARWSLAMALDSRYQLHYNIQDIDLAVQAYSVVVDMLEKQSKEYLFTYTRYAAALEARWYRKADVNDLHIALKYCEIVVRRCPPGHEHYMTVLVYYTSLLIIRSQQRESIQDADTAIQCIRNAIAGCRVDDPRRPTLLSNLGNCLTIRFLRCGDAADLETAVENCYAALSSDFSLDAGIRAGHMNQLAFALFTRFQLQGDTTDANSARSFLKQAFETCPSPHSNRLPILNNYARLLGLLGRKNSDISDINLSIKYFYQVLDLCYASARSIVLINLGVALLHRHSQTSELDDIEFSFSLIKAALELQPEGHLHRGMTFLVQAKVVIAMFPRKYTLVDTEIALDILRAAEDAFTAGQPMLIETYRELSRVYSLRHAITHNDNDLEEEFRCRIAAAQYPNGGTEVQFEAAMQWVESGETFNHSSLLDAYRSAIQILNLHLVLKPSLNLRHNIIKSQALSICVDATSCALRRNDVVGAVEMFEHSRGLFWTFMARLRTPLDELRASGPDGQDLADEFENLSRQLETPMTLGDDGENGQRFRRIQKDWNAVVNRIRSVDGFGKFLLPPSYESLRAAAIGGPVIILNASEYSCDAIIVLADAEPIHVPFPKVIIADLKEMSTNFQNLKQSLRRYSNDRDKASDEKALFKVLRDLWDYVVCGVVRSLEPHTSSNSRIWWCPTGVFTTLPIHAAGPYRKGGRGLSDIYVSSYTPTLSALIRSRKKRNSAQQGVPVMPRLVSIGQPNSAGFKPLHTVRKELDLVHQLLPQAVQFTELTYEAATREGALSALSTHTYAHLACHGKQDLKEPFLSHFAMGNGPLTLLDVIGNHQAGHEIEFMFLSACQTATGDENAPDEVIHLAAALQFAGAQNVVGTMWSVDDDVVPLIVEAFYRAMVNKEGVFDPSLAARALRAATRAVKARIPLDQRMVFIHIGV